MPQVKYRNDPATHKYLPEQRHGRTGAAHDLPKTQHGFSNCASGLPRKTSSSAGSRLGAQGNVSPVVPSNVLPGNSLLSFFLLHPDEQGVYGTARFAVSKVVINWS